MDNEKVETLLRVIQFVTLIEETNIPLSEDKAKLLETVIKKIQVSVDNDE